MRLEVTAGTKHRHAKLTDEQVYEIRRLCDQGADPHKEAPRFGIHPVHFARIGRRQRWKHLPEKQS